MPDVDIKVLEAEIQKATKDQSIGTCGVATCVGLVVVDNDLAKTCAHFDDGYTNIELIQKKTAKVVYAEIQSKATAILINNFPSKDKVKKIGCCAPGKGKGNTPTGSIVNAITLYYGAKITEKDINTAQSAVLAKKDGSIEFPSDEVDPIANAVKTAPNTLARIK